MAAASGRSIRLITDRRLPGGKETASVRPRSRARLVRWGGYAVLIAAFVGWRGMHLDADPPADFIPQDIGYHVDEGYKTLSPRNLALFGTTHWNPADGYEGWMRASPLTQWSYYLSFRSFGVNHDAARLVSVSFFALFLILAAAFLAGRGSPAVVLTGLVLLGSDMALFHFSRVALFEIALCLLLYSGIFLANSVSSARRFTQLAILLATMIVAALTVKESALLYLAPPLVLLVLAELVGDRTLTGAKVLIGGTALMLGLAVLYLTTDRWQGRVDPGVALDTPSAVLFHPTYLLSPLALSLAYLVTLDIVLRRGVEEFRENRYLLAVSSIALFVPLILPLFRYDPPRYYLPVIPAALLMSVEWLRLRRAGRLEDAYRLSPARVVVTVLILLPLGASFLGFAGAHVVPVFPFLPQGADPGIDLATLILLYPAALALLGATAMVVLRTERLHAGIPAAIVLAMVLQVVFSVATDARAVLRPTYSTAEIEQRLEEAVGEGESVGGDWAPYLALGTTIPALYMTDDWNTAEDVDETQPTYFLNSNTVWDLRNLSDLESRAGIGVGPPLNLGTIFDHEIQLRRLSYLPGS